MASDQIADPWTVDPDTLTLGELAVFEQVAGTTIEETIDGLRDSAWVLSGSFLVATVMVANARSGNPMSIEDAAAVPFSVFAIDDSEE